MNQPRKVAPKSKVSSTPRSGREVPASKISVKPPPETIEESIARFYEIFPGVEKTRINTFTNSRYASLDDIWNAAKPFLLKIQLRAMAWIEDGVLWVQLVNKDGAQFMSNVKLPDSTTEFQKFGAAITYFRRYLICTMLGIVETEDDDGNSGAKPTNAIQPIAENQLSTIVDLMAATETAESNLINYVESTYNKSKLEELTYPEAAIIIKLLKSKLDKPSSE